MPINSEPADDRLRKVSPDAPRFPTLDSIPRPDPATLAFLTTGQQYVAAASQHPYQVKISHATTRRRSLVSVVYCFVDSALTRECAQTQDVRPSPGRSRPERSLSPKGQGIAGQCRTYFPIATSSLLIIICDADDQAWFVQGGKAWIRRGRQQECSRTAAGEVGRLISCEAYSSRQQLMPCCQQETI